MQVGCDKESLLSLSVYREPTVLSYVWPASCLPSLSVSVSWFCSFVSHLFTLLAFFPLALLWQLYRFSSTNYTARCRSACGPEMCRTNSSVSMQPCSLDCCHSPLCLRLNASSYGNCPQVPAHLRVRG